MAMLQQAGINARLGSPADAEQDLVVVCDATTAEDLDRVAHEIARAAPRPIVAGASGLASRLPAALGFYETSHHRWRPCNRPVAIVGTRAAMAKDPVAVDSETDSPLCRPSQLHRDL